MVKSDFTYAVSLFRREGQLLGTMPVKADWEPALESTLFEAICQERVSPAGIRGEDPTIEPVWDAKRGAPWLEGFRVILDGGEGKEVSKVFSTAYFRRLVEGISALSVQRGDLQKGERFQYAVAAFSHEPEDKPTESGAMRAKSARAPLVFRETPFADFESAASFVGNETDSDVPVFIPGDVLREAVAATREAGSREAGGILIGFLHRDPESRRVFIEVTAQIPARYNRSEPTSLTFTADTWAAVQAAIDLRDQREQWLGWWHSHSYLKDVCGKCDKKKKAESCDAHAAFLSAEDRHLHRTVFYGAHQLALVLSDAPCSGLVWAFYGWREGSIHLRSFYVLNKGGQEGDRNDSGATEIGAREGGNYAVG